MVDASVLGAGVTPEVGPEPAHTVRVPVVYQDWMRVGFVHWRYRADDVQRALPDGLTVETFDGAAWVTVTPFVIERMRPPGSPPLPHLGAFPETNLRTYVTGPDGRRGIWFFALDCGSMLPVALGRGVFFQPYHRSELSVEGDAVIAYRGERRWPRTGAAYDIELEVGTRYAAAELGDLDHFLTGRWTLFTFYGPVTAAAYVEHEPWPLRHARVARCDQTLTRAAGLPDPGTPALAHFSDAVRAKLSAPFPIKAGAGEARGA